MEKIFEMFGYTLVGMYFSLIFNMTYNNLIESTFLYKKELIKILIFVTIIATILALINIKALVANFPLDWYEIKCIIFNFFVIRSFNRLIKRL
uniref:Uncharacterized protein n=1 Tax=Cyanoptyche gloeocystis TaxID=77922 RepID=A0A096Y6W5_9EUKA|nr:hypothetical protein NX25_p19 [Cyanoptyche gloeocystis]AIM52076.1 hypothetical protein [Cyanoptyche gloeocystis]